MLDFIKRKLTEKLYRERHQAMKLQLEKAYLQQRVDELKRMKSEK